MYTQKRFIYYIALLVLGAALLLAGYTGALEEFWSGFGGGLLGVSAIRLLDFARYRRNGDYKKQVDVREKDERNHFLADKARSWTMYFSVLLLGVLCLGFQIAGLHLYSLFCGYTVCGMMAIYWLCWLVLRRKY
ncbi:MAG: hypothetical protein ACI3WR_04905 [Oscillospiraceae bacterium]